MKLGFVLVAAVGAALLVPAVPASAKPTVPVGNSYWLSSACLNSHPCGLWLNRQSNGRGWMTIASQYVGEGQCTRLRFSSSKRAKGTVVGLGVKPTRVQVIFKSKGQRLLLNQYSGALRFHAFTRSSKKKVNRSLTGKYRMNIRSYCEG